MQEAKNPYQAGIITLKYLIKEWNFVDKKGSPAAINEATLGQLPSKDTVVLIGKATSLILKSQDKKKMNSKKLLSLLDQEK